MVSKTSFFEVTFPSERHFGGYLQGKRDFQKILSKLERDPASNKIIEKIQIYSHSRGGAFATGYTEALLEMIRSHADEFSDPANVIEFVLHLAPHQSDYLSANSGVREYSIDHSRDGLSGNDMQGLQAAFTSDEKAEGLVGAHSIDSFVYNVKAFTQAITRSGGDRKSLIDLFVKIMRQNYGVKVTVK